MTDSPSLLHEPLRFAYWVPNVSGGLVVSNIEQRTSWTTGYEVMSWKDACGVPQRGS